MNKFDTFEDASEGLTQIPTRLVWSTLIYLVPFLLPLLCSLLLMKLLRERSEPVLMLAEGFKVIVVMVLAYILMFNILSRASRGLSLTRVDWSGVAGLIGFKLSVSWGRLV